jgi:hypothetical protein
VNPCKSSPSHCSPGCTCSSPHAGPPDEPLLLPYQPEELPLLVPYPPLSSKPPVVSGPEVEGLGGAVVIGGDGSFPLVVAGPDELPPLSSGSTSGSQATNPNATTTSHARFIDGM